MADVEKEGIDGGSSYKSIDIGSELGKLFEKPTELLTSIFKLTKERLGFEAIFNSVKDLDSQSADLVKALGVGSKRGIELTQTISDAIPKFVELGMTAGDAAKTYTSLIESLDTNIMLSDETLTNFAATARVTGTAQKDLALNFRDVGVGIASVGDNMLKVVNVARQAGVTTAAVSSGVVTNLDKMNKYNFENGIVGLAKMAAQASRLGIDMGKVFQITENVFNPEGAIDFAASLQRLGVTSSQLLDPLRLMDLAQNDPTELQNQIVGMTKEFTRFNKENNQFEILPGAKRRLDEIGKSMGLTNGELQKMALNAASFDMKLKQIKFSPGIKDEDREFIATMATINKGGEAIVRVKEVVGGKETGEFIEKRAGELTENEVKLLREQQALGAKSIEEISIDQLSEMKKTNALLDKMITAENYGIAGNRITQDTYKGLNKQVRDVVSKAPQESKDYRVGVDKSFEVLNGIMDKMGINMGDIVTKLSDIMTSITSSPIFTSVGNITSDIFTGAGEIISNAVSTAISATPLNLSIPSTISLNNTPSTPTEITLNHNVNVKGDIASNLNKKEVENIFYEMTTNMSPIIANEIVAKSSKINSGLTIA
jgi:hypothetical protein